MFVNVRYFCVHCFSGFCYSAIKTVTRHCHTNAICCFILLETEIHQLGMSCETNTNFQQELSNQLNLG